MTRRIVAVAIVLLLLALPATAQAPTVPPAGAVVIIVGVSDGLTVLPFGQAVVPPLACLPGGAP